MIVLELSADIMTALNIFVKSCKKKYIDCMIYFLELRKYKNRAAILSVLLFLVAKFFKMNNPG